MPGAVRDSGHRLLLRLRGGKQAQQSGARHWELWDSQVGKGQSFQRAILLKRNLGKFWWQQSWKRSVMEENNASFEELIKNIDIQPWRDGGQHDAVDGVGEQLGERLLLGAVAYWHWERGDDHDGGDVHDDGLDSWLDFPEEQLYTKTERGDDHGGHDGDGYADDNSFSLPKQTFAPWCLGVLIFLSCRWLWRRTALAAPPTWAETTRRILAGGATVFGGGAVFICISGNLLVTSICYFMLLLAC